MTSTLGAASRGLLPLECLLTPLCGSTIWRITHLVQVAMQIGNVKSNKTRNNNFYPSIDRGTGTLHLGEDTYTVPLKIVCVHVCVHICVCVHAWLLHACVCVRDWTIGGMCLFCRFCATLAVGVSS